MVELLHRPLDCLGLEKGTNHMKTVSMADLKPNRRPQKTANHAQQGRNRNISPESDGQHDATERMKKLWKNFQQKADYKNTSGTILGNCLIKARVLDVVLDDDDRTHKQNTCDNQYIFPSDSSIIPDPQPKPALNVAKTCCPERFDFIRCCVHTPYVGTAYISFLGTEQ